ncbi:OmpA family protein [Herbaspirillum sp. WGmk3]|nr:OmpA family protein [Herbaspirillum sp. WGmk3]MCO4857219.1 OmpA family protein [Herbaspirillum sp. WGmk3]
MKTNILSQTRRLTLLSAAWLACSVVHAQNVAPPVATPAPGQVLVTGTVPDEASKAAALARLREVYGADRVVDQIAVGQVVLPANWNNHVQKLISPNLKAVSRGQLKIDGTSVSISGEVSNEAQRQQIASDMASSLNSSYTVNNGLRVSTSEQGLLDNALANRVVAFESGQATLTPEGKRILDEIAATMLKLKGRHVEIIGNTDNEGLRASNISLSLARADAVKAYLSAKGVDESLLTTSGQGPDRPVASNNTAEGRAKNRRIEFRIAK